MTLTWNQLINTFFNSYELDIDGFNELAINYYYEPEIYNGEGFYFEIFPEDEDYTYWCKEYDMNPDDQEIIEVENYFYQYYLIDKETADNLKEYTNLTVFYFPDEDKYYFASQRFDIWGSDEYTLKKELPTDFKTPLERKIEEYNKPIKTPDIDIDGVINTIINEILPDLTEAINEDAKRMIEESERMIEESERIVESNKMTNYKLSKHILEYSNREYNNIDLCGSIYMMDELIESFSVNFNTHEIRFRAHKKEDEDIYRTESLTDGLKYINHLYDILNIELKIDGLEESTWESLSEDVLELGCPNEYDNGCEYSEEPTDIALSAVEWYLMERGFYDYLYRPLTKEEFKEAIDILSEFGTVGAYEKLLDKSQEMIMDLYPDIMKKNLIPEAVEKLGL